MMMGFPKFIGIHLLDMKPIIINIIENNNQQMYWQTDMYKLRPGFIYSSERYDQIMHMLWNTIQTFLMWVTLIPALVFSKSLRILVSLGDKISYKSKEIFSLSLTCSCHLTCHVFYTGLLYCSFATTSMVSFKIISSLF